MQIPQLKQPDKYVGLYVLEFDGHTSVGFTASEVAELFDSERYKNTKVYKIHKAYPDGTLEIKGVPSQAFQLESGMFFYETKQDSAESDFKKLTDIAVTSAPPCRVKVHLAQRDENSFLTAVIYPAEYNDEISDWLLANNYETSGPAEGGVEATQRYYDQAPKILKTHQLFAGNENQNRSGTELLTSLKKVLQR